MTDQPDRIPDERLGAAAALKACLATLQAIASGETFRPPAAAREALWRLHDSANHSPLDQTTAGLLRLIDATPTDAVTPRDTEQMPPPEAAKP